MRLLDLLTAWFAHVDPVALGIILPFWQHQSRGAIDSGGVVHGDSILMGDGTSYILLGDGTSRILLGS